MDTTTNIFVQAGTWVNLYSESEITVGTQIHVENLSEAYNARLVTSATEPDGSGFANLPPLEVRSNLSGATGAWIWCEHSIAVNVSEAP